MRASLTPNTETSWLSPIMYIKMHKPSYESITVALSLYIHLYHDTHHLFCLKPSPQCSIPKGRLVVPHDTRDLIPGSCEHVNFKYKGMKGAATKRLASKSDYLELSEWGQNIQRSLKEEEGGKRGRQEEENSLIQYWVKDRGREPEVKEHLELLATKKVKYASYYLHSGSTMTF